MAEGKKRGRRVADPDAGIRVQVSVKVHPLVARFLQTVGNVSQYVEQAIREKHRRDRKVKASPSPEA